MCCLSLFGRILLRQVTWCSDSFATHLMWTQMGQTTTGGQGNKQNNNATTSSDEITVRCLNLQMYGTFIKKKKKKMRADCLTLAFNLARNTEPKF